MSRKETSSGSKELSKKRKDSSTQELSRRTFLKIALGGGVAVAAAKLLESLGSSPSYLKNVKLPTGSYEGHLDKLKGKEFLGEDKLKRYLEILNETQDPFFQKIARLISTSFTAPTQLRDLPPWIKNPAPLLATAESDYAYVSYFPTQEDIPSFQQGTQKGRFLKSMEWGILVAKDTIEPNGEFAEALFLAKEYLTFSLVVSLAEHFYRVVDFSAQHSPPILDLNGHLITNPDFQKKNW